MDDMSAFGIIGLVFLLIGPLALIGSVAVTIYRRRQRDRMQRTTATIVDYAERWPRSRRGRSTLSYYPIVTFQTIHGQSVTIESSMGSSPRVGGVGQPIEVFYDPADPHRIQINATVFNLLPTCLLLFLGSIFTAIGGIFTTIFFSSR